jgi:DNA-binding transcriptional LysR family regulator
MRMGSLRGQVRPPWTDPLNLPGSRSQEYGVSMRSRIHTVDIRAVDLNLLPVFDALLRHRSVTLAARELDMSQPAVSAALARLRALLGDALFVRTGRGLLPTARADLLAQPVTEILERVRDRVMQAQGFDPARSRRAFRLLLSDVGAYVLWPRILQAVRAQAPQASIELRQPPGTDIARELAEGRLDLAAGSFPGLLASIMQRRLFERRFVGLVAHDHRFAGRRPTVREFAAIPQVVVQGTSGIQQSVDEALARHRRRRLDTVELPSYLMVPALLDAGDFLAVMPGQLAEAFARHGRFAVVPLPIALPTAVVRLHWHRRFHDDAGNAWLRRIVVEACGDR